ncbi:MAG: valine--tRNA ligase [Elusimicrobia bacterium CG08_land_8_20_14_0_20_51_18]|nr:MAG: valine--tRNA ligase [Elusimicrobia bacterium CG08_land_8_20_14_0_20_51_18]
MLPKTYDPKPVEEKWTRLWQENRVFRAGIDKSRKSFTIVIPPPNITGALHMGHALNNALQDVLIRYRRLSGESSFWAPGTDHGGIATQNVLEKMLKAEGKTKEDLGREQFLKRMWDWYKECGGTILQQLKKLGCSLDFSPENIRFTMDETRAKAVYQAFKELWEKELIYRGERMINWCPRCYTALSDIEVEFEEERSHLWRIKYPVENSDSFVTVATTRPETMLGDMAVAVHPEDKRYRKLIGKNLKLPLTDRLISVIADEEIDMAFGTGAVKVTPSHDPVDFQISQRHGLAQMPVISYEGRMMNCREKYLGKKTALARKEIVEDLQALGLLEKEEPYTHNVGKCYRCSNHIEPLVSEQWFVRTRPLAEKALEKTKNGELTFYPESWQKPFDAWLEKIQDWCISRQIWWGHRIPAWYCRKCSGEGLHFDEKGELRSVSVKKGAKPAVSREKPLKCEHCGGQDFLQDPDVLDTWFSSALWPFSVFGWPSKTPELGYFYPTSALVTGYEILHLWVARMVMSGIFHLGELPFKKVYVHGIVRDKHGQKMSKSKGNVIDPLDMMAKYGTDSMRFSLLIQAVGGKDIPFSENSIIGGRNFVNKIYNVSRFLQMNLVPGENYELELEGADLSDRWILHRYNQTLSEYKKLMDEFLLPEALDKLYGFLWDEFCDWYIELAKPDLQTENKKKKLSILINVFLNSMKLLHPFMPFITEEIFADMKTSAGSTAKSLMDEKLPRPNKKLEDETSLRKMGVIMEIIKSIRTIRSQFTIPPRKEMRAVITSSNGALEDIKPFGHYIKNLARLSELELSKAGEKPKMSVSAVMGEFNIFVLMEGDIDPEKEKNRLSKERQALLAGTKTWEKKMQDGSFLKNAPEAEVEKIRQRIAENNDKISRIGLILKELER